MRLSYQVYVTDALQNIPQNKYSTVRWLDTLKEQDTRTGDEIAIDVISSVGLKFGDE